MSWSKLVDMEMDDEDKIDCALPIAPTSKPDYPWGLRISLCEKDLKKLGLDCKDAEIGDMIDMRCFGVVMSISQSQGDGYDSCRVEIQIQKIAIENEMTEDEGSDDD